MNYKSLYLKTTSRALIIAGLTGLVVTSVLWGSSGFANHSPGSNDSSRQPIEPATVGRVPDLDTLDIEGAWSVIQSLPAGFIFDSSGHRTTSGPPASTWTHRICLTRTGRNAFGGDSFRGRMTDPPVRGDFSGDTFYGGAGVQVVQMRFVEEIGSLRYYKLFAGQHQRYERDPTRVEVDGGWAYVGYLAEGKTTTPSSKIPSPSGMDGSFAMVKVAPSCP